MASNLFDSPFGETFVPIASSQQGGATTPLPGIGTPALNTPVDQPDSLKIGWRGEGFVQAVDNAKPAQVDSVFGPDGGFFGLDQSSGGGGATNGALDSPFDGSVMWPKP